MRKVLVVFLSFVLALYGCGGGGGDGRISQAPMSIPDGHDYHSTIVILPSEGLPFPFYKEGTTSGGLYTHFSISELPAQDPSDARHQPVYHDHNEVSRLFVGIDQGTGYSTGYTRELPVYQRRSGTVIRYGQLDFDPDREEVTAFIADAIEDLSDVKRYTKAPDVRITGPSTRKERNRVIAAVRLVNASLPPQFKMTVGPPLPSSAYDYDYDITRDNTIHIQFNHEDVAHAPDAGGITFNYPGNEDGEFEGNEIKSSFIEINKDAPVYMDFTDRRNVILIAHELMHALGLFGGEHVDRVRFASILEAYSTIYLNAQSTPPYGHPFAQPMSLLYPVDRAAIRALYSLDPGDSPYALGPWSSTATHIHGNREHTGFGVAYRNGYAEPWAYGYNPPFDLRQNTSLRGNVTWRGTLLGFTPQVQAVAGNASVSVNMSSLNGRADFTGLEYWRTDAVWGDGDLTYSIAVRGNTFKQTGGDAGILTGIFVGQSHEGAAGTLERRDLTAAFGASR